MNGGNDVGISDISERLNDQITDFSYVGHGKSSNLLPGYNAVRDGVDVYPLRTSAFSALSFSANANVNLNACGSGYRVMDDFVNRLISGNVTG